MMTSGFGICDYDEMRHYVYMNTECIMSHGMDCALTPVGVVVQWLDYLAVTQEPGVTFPTAKKVEFHVATSSYATVDELRYWYISHNRIDKLVPTVWMLSAENSSKLHVCAIMDFIAYSKIVINKHTTLNG